jgi:type I restriction enzyme S subunit
MHIEQVPPGYKLTEVGIIPSDWDVKAILDCADYVDYRGKTPPKTSSGIFLVTAKNIKDGFIDYEISQEYVSEFDYEIIMRRGLPKLGDILITTEAPLGNVAMVDRENIALAQRVIKYRAKAEILESSYLKYYFLSITFKNILDNHSSGSTAKGIKGSVLHRLSVIVPPIAEQKRIAQVLSDIDELIRSLDELIIKKRNIKQGTMQLLLTGKQRLPGYSGEWEVKKLGELGNFSKGKGIKKDDIIFDGLPCIRYGEIYTRHNYYIKKFYSFISNNIAKQSQLLNKGDLLFAGSGETSEEIGKCVAFIGDEEAYAGGDIVIFKPLNQSSLYLGYLMNYSSITQQKSKMGQGDAVVHISAKNLSQLQLYLPPLEEQKAIAQILSDMDEEIEVLEAKRDKYQDIKKGMMQELLTGKTRLLK